MDLYTIKDLAEKSGRAVFTVQQLSNLAGISKAVAKVYMGRLVKKGLAKKIQRGKISFSSDDFVNATQIIEPSYISLRSALLFYNLIKQVPTRVECVTTKNSMTVDGIVYHKINPRLFYGYKKMLKGSSYFFIAEPEKAVIDSLYLNIISKQDIQDIKNKLDSEKFEKFVRQYTGKGRKKMGILL